MLSTKWEKFSSDFFVTTYFAVDVAVWRDHDVQGVHGPVKKKFKLVYFKKLDRFRWVLNILFIYNQLAY